MTELSPKLIAGAVYAVIGIFVFCVFLICHIRNGSGGRRLHWILTLLRWLLYSPLLWPLLLPTLIRFLKSPPKEAVDEPE